MADVKDVRPLLDQLNMLLDNLDRALPPLVGGLQGLVSRVPLLDQAKLFSVSAYSIHSLLYSALKLEGVDAQNHAVYTELRRIQQCYAKIKALEQPRAVEEPEAPQARTTSVNQEAAARVLKADLSDNPSIGSKLAEKIAEERAKALLKSVENQKRPAEDEAPAASSASASEERPRGKKAKRGSRSKTRSTRGGRVSKH